MTCASCVTRSCGYFSSSLSWLSEVPFSPTSSTRASKGRVVIRRGGRGGARRCATTTNNNNDPEHRLHLHGDEARSRSRETAPSTSSSDVTDKADDSNDRKVSTNTVPWAPLDESCGGGGGDSSGATNERRGRRDALLDGVGAFLGAMLTTTTLGGSGPSAAASASAGGKNFEDVLKEKFIYDDEVERLQSAAIDAFSRRDFPAAEASLLKLTALQPDNPSWHEALGQCYVDGSSLRPQSESAKRREEGDSDSASAVDSDDVSNFRAAAAEFTTAIALTPAADSQSRARLLAGRALAAEGASNWSAALADYDDALATAAAAGLPADPYIVNCRGNVLAASGDYARARDAYLDSAATFQATKGVNSVQFNQLRGDGYTFAASNAALALAQLGDTKRSMAEMEKISRRAPGNADMRAALAALYWSEGREEDAEREWEYACDRISVGCSKYKDKHWLTKVRRWPPKMVTLLDKFVNIR